MGSSCTSGRGDLALLVVWEIGGAGETGLSPQEEGMSSMDEFEPEYLEWPREKVGVTGEGEAISEEDELCV